MQDEAEIHDALKQEMGYLRTKVLRTLANPQNPEPYLIEQIKHHGLVYIPIYSVGKYIKDDYYKTKFSKYLIGLMEYIEFMDQTSGSILIMDEMRKL